MRKIFDSEKLSNARRDKEKLKSFIEEKDKDFFSYLEKFAEKEENMEFTKKNYDVAIYTIGLSPYTTLLSLFSLKPKEKIVFIFTESSLQYKEIFERFMEAVDSNTEIATIKTKSDSDTAEVFNIMIEEMDKYSEKKIAVDITGGKKPTIAAGFLGTSIYNKRDNIDILYLDFHDYDGDNPVYGTEFLSRLLNPDDIFGTVEQRALQEMYSSYNFRGARRLSKSIESRLKRNAKIFSEYKIQGQIEGIQKIYYFSKVYELRYNMDYINIEINDKYLNPREKQGLAKLKNGIKMKNEILNIEKLSNDEKGREIYKKFNKSDELLYLILDRYKSSLMIRDIDLLSYIMRLFSCIELSGIILSEGKEHESFKKISMVKENKLKGALEKLRKTRNNLGLVHGFGSISQPDKNLENAVLEYIGLSFGKGEKELNFILDKYLEYRDFNKILG